MVNVGWETRAKAWGVLYLSDNDTTKLCRPFRSLRVRVSLSIRIQVWEQAWDDELNEQIERVTKREAQMIPPSPSIYGDAKYSTTEPGRPCSAQLSAAHEC